MKFEPLEKVTASSQVASQIRNAILTGELGSGERLSSERQLAADFGVNRSTIREALRSLEQMGLVKIRHGGGVEVLDFYKSGGLGLLPHLLLATGFDAPLLLDILEARQVLGVAITRRAARQRGGDQLTRLQKLVVQLEEAQDQAARFGALDVEFFRVLARAGNNRVYLFIMNAINRVFESRYEMFEGLFRQPARFGRLHHEAVVAIAAGDEEGAAKAMERYLQMALDDFRKGAKRR